MMMMRNSSIWKSEHTVKRSASENKLMHNFNRNRKSLKFLNTQLLDYKAATPRKNSKDLHKEPQPQEQPSPNQQQPSTHRQSIDSSSQAKYRAFIDNLLLNLNIFKKVYQNSKKKKDILKKLYGWDQMFKDIFFVDQQLKPNLNKDEVLVELGLDKKCFASQNTYNKLRFFLSELVNINFRQQEIECLTQREKLAESCSKVVRKIESFSTESRRSKDYINQMKNTHYEMLGMKMRIKNRGGELEKIARNTGSIRLNPFFFKQQKNIHQIESFLRDTIKG